MKRPRIYTYKITFPDQGWWYWGVHKETELGEEYWGSPVTHKEKWRWFEFEKQILEYFDSYAEARAVEIRLIKPDLNNPLCLNESCGGLFSDHLVSRSKGPMSESTKQKLREINLGRIRPQWERERISRGQFGRESWCKGKKLSEETKLKMSKAHAGRTVSDETREKISQANKGRVFHESICYHYRCLITGTVSTGAGLTKIQRRLGIDTALRERIE